MSKPSDFHPDRNPRRGVRLAAMTGLALIAAGGMLLLQLPRGAAAGIAASDSHRAAPRVPPSTTAANPKTPGTYQLRCWQYGHLLFDEGPVTLAGDARQAARLVAIDRQGAALIVSDVGGTTCLARPSAPAPNLALPH